MAEQEGLLHDGQVVVVDRTTSAGAVGGATRRPAAREAEGDTPAGPAAHGLERLRTAIVDRGATAEVVDHWSETDHSVCVVAGTTDGSLVGRLLSEVDASLDRPEGLVYRWCPTRDGTALVVAGTDETGLMYALLELAERVDAAGLAALDDVADEVQFPDNAVRGVDRYVQGPVADGWLYDEAFWRAYVARLARCRFNRLVLITGYDSAFMSPPYPFFVDVPGHRSVTLSDDVSVSREAHRELLRTIGRLCRAHGLEFGLGIWQQQPWTEAQGRLVEGLPGDDRAFAEYCAAGAYELLTQVPEIDVLQLRVNHEAGVRDDADGGPVVTAEEFWREVLDGVERAADDRKPPLALDLRAKGLTDRMIDWGQETGLDVTVPTKFTWEAMGLPYHPTRLRSPELADVANPDRGRRYSYADLLEQPRAFDVLYRLWMVGTSRLLLWGDPDYARRFSRAARFGDATGFEVGAPLGLKGGHFFLQDEPWAIHDDPDLRHYEFEDDRYWAWYRLFGRLGYDADADPEVYRRAFSARFGEAADDVLEAYRAVSKVLPLLTSAHLTHHPAQHNWGELDTGAALFPEHNVNPVFAERGTTYQSAEPGDPGLFYGVDEYVADRHDGDLDDRYTPPQVARWYRGFAAATREALDAARETDDPSTTGAEFAATETDLLLVADLADYHAEKSLASVGLATHRETGDATALREAAVRMDRALEHWRSLAERGGAAYHDDLVFALGPARGDAGTWADRLPELEADRDRLGDRLEEVDGDPDSHEAGPPEPDATAGPAQGRTGDLDVPERVPAGEPVTVSVAVDERARGRPLRLHYRHADQTAGAFRTTEMERTDEGFRATIPASCVVPEWDLLVYVAGRGADGAVVLPGLYAPDHHAPYHIVVVRDEGA